MKAKAAGDSAVRLEAVRQSLAQSSERAGNSVVPMAFCFPGYDAKGSDLPPPALCAATWRAQVTECLGPLPLTLLVGGAAIRWHLGLRDVTAAVADWRAPSARGVFPLPHPSWRNTGWLKRHPWFEAELIPALRQRVREVLDV